MKNLFCKNKKADKTISHNPALERKVKRGYRFYCTVIVAMSFVCSSHRRKRNSWS